MQLDAQDYLELVEKTGDLLFFDIESTSLNGDFGSIVCVSLKTHGRDPVTFKVNKVGDDKKLIQNVSKYMAERGCWVSYYGKGFDIKMLNTRLLYHKLPAMTKNLHLDLYYSVRYQLKLGSGKLGHMVDWLRLGEGKMTVPTGVWAEVAMYPKKNIPILVDRCESDVRILENLYNSTKHLVVNITK